MNSPFLHRFFLICIGIVTFGYNLHSQDFLVKCVLSETHWKNGWCGSGTKQFKDVKVKERNYTKIIETYASYPGRYSGSKTIYGVCTKNFHVGMSFNEEDFTGHQSWRWIKHRITSAKKYSELKHSASKLRGGCTYKGKITLNITAYDVPKITKVSYPSCTSGFCSGSSFCINSDSDKIRFNLSVKNKGNASLYIHAYSRSNKEIGYAYIGTYNSVKEVSISSLGIPENYNGEVRFRVRASLGGKKADGDYSSYYIFSKMLPAPTSKIMTRTACLDEIRLTMPSGIAANHKNYRFIWINGTRDIRLTSYYRGGNYIYLRNNSSSPFPTSRGSITIQIADKKSDNCARNFSVNSGSKPSYLSITATPMVKATFDATSYHISKYGANDGVITLRVTGGSESRISRFEYLNNSRWVTIPSSQLTYVYQNTWRFTGLVANRRYLIRVYDTDGCVNGYITTPALRQPARVTLNQPTATVVTCHVNNSGTGSKSDGVIRATCRGGIGNYTARLYSNSGSLIDTKTITASNKSGSGYYTQFNPRGVGRYRVRVTDKYGVYKDRYINVTSNPEVVLSAIPADASCYGGSSGSVQLSVSNKRTTYATYELTGEISKYISGSTAGFSGLKAGTYAASVTNTDGCQDVVNHISVGQPNDIIINATGSDIARYGDNTGTINLDIREGTGDFDYILYRGPTEIADGSTSQNATISGLRDGYYRVEVIDDNGCQQTHGNIRVRQPEAPLELSFSKQQQNVDCFGNATGEVYPTATGGWGHYQYGFNGTVNGPGNTIGGLTATGAIADTVFVVDAAGVVEKLPVTITEPSQLITSVGNIYGLKCFEDNSGAVRLNISGGTPGYRVSTDSSNWVPGDSISNLPAGINQTLYIWDANNCPGSETVTVTQPDLLDGEVNRAYDLLCYQDATGAVKLDISGGTTPYAISVDKTSWYIADSIGGLQANANQDIWIRDNHGCYDSLVTSILQPDLLEATPSIEHLRCFEDNSGEIDMDVRGGTSPYYISTDSLNWFSGSIISGMASNPAQNVYIRDGHNCVTKNTVAINQPEDLTTTIDSIYHLRCFNDSSGAVDLEIQGGTAPYSVSHDAINWINGDYIDNLSANPSLTLYVKDNNGCETNRPVGITQPDELVAEIDNVYNLRCYDDNSGALKLNIQGGTNPYQVSQGYSTWVTGDSLSNLSATNASDFYIRDNHNCETSLNATIGQPEGLQIGVDSVIDAYCNQNNGKINVSVGGGTIANNYDYTWQYVDSMQYFNARDELQNIYSGQYKLLIADDNACKDSINILVSDLDGPVLNTWHSDSVTCFGGDDGAIYIDNVTGGGGFYTFYLDGQEFADNISGLERGRYHFRIVDNKNCVVNEYLEVHQPDSLGYTITESLPTCNGLADGAFSLNLTGGNGGYNHSWSDGETSLSRNNLKSGWYMLSVSDRLECNTSFNIFLDEPEPLVANAGLVSPLCSYSSDGRISSVPAGGNGGYKFTWNTGDTTTSINQLGAGVYSLLLSDAKNCIVDTSFTLSSPDTLIINPEPVNPSCFGDANGAISTNPIGGTGSYNYWWNTGSTSDNITGLRKGTYSLIVRDANNCQVSGNYALNEPAELSLIANILEPTCNGYNNGSISVGVSGGNGNYVFKWNTNHTASELTKLIAGEYSLTVTDAKNCSINKAYTINEPAPVSVQAIITEPTCHDSNDGIIRLSANGGSGSYTYQWNNNTIEEVLPGLGKGVYSIITADINNCTNSNEFVVKAPLPPTANLGQNVGVLCTGNSLELDGGDFISYKWYKDAVLVSEGRYLTVDRSGEYTLEISDKDGCIGLDTFNLKVSDKPLDAVIIVKDSALVNEVVEAIDVTWPVPDSIQWLFDHPVELVDSNDWMQQFTASATGVLNVTLRAWYGGCFSDSSKTVTIYYEEGAMPQKSAIYEPLILGYRAYPNPNNGNFTVGVELSREADISLHLFYVGSGSTIDIKHQHGLESYEIPYNLTGLMQGVYVIVLVAEHEQQRLKIVIE